MIPLLFLANGVLAAIAWGHAEGSGSVRMTRPRRVALAAIVGLSWLGFVIAAARVGQGGA